MRCVEVRYLFSSAICVFGDFVMLASGFYSLGSRHISSLVLWVLSWCACRGMLVGARGFLFRSVLVLFSSPEQGKRSGLFQYGSLSVPKRGSSVRAL